MFAGAMTFTLTACSDDSDTDKEPDGSKPDQNTEKKSTLLGTWVNQASDDLVYYLVFKEDGSGYYIKEGIRELNFNIFDKKEFKWTGINIVNS